MSNFCCVNISYIMRLGVCISKYNIPHCPLCLGFPRKPNMRLSQKISCDSLDSQKNSKRKTAFSETTSPPKRSQPGEIKTSSPLKTLGKNGQTHSFYAKGSMVLRAQGPAMMATKISVERALRPLRSRVSSSAVPTVILTPEYIGR